LMAARMYRHTTSRSTSPRSNISSTRCSATRTASLPCRSISKWAARYSSRSEIGRRFTAPPKPVFRSRGPRFGGTAASSSRSAAQAIACWLQPPNGCRAFFLRAPRFAPAGWPAPLHGSASTPTPAG